MNEQLFGGGYTRIHTINMYCDTCKRELPHYHIFWDYLELYRCQLCDTVREKGDDLRQEILPTDQKTGGTSIDKKAEVGTLPLLHILAGDNGSHMATRKI